VCSLHQVDLAISWADRIVGLRHGEVVLDTPTTDLTKAAVMEIYGRVATTTAEIRAVQEELVVAAAQVAAS
jgi:phosphonate transport system ATP-binding protein